MIFIFAVGQKQPAWVNAAVADYLNRFPADTRPLLKEIKTEPRTTGKSAAALMAAEADRIKAAIPKDTVRIALDEHGKVLTTEELFALIEKLHQHFTHIAFMIGGPDGLDPDLKSSCQHQIRVSSMTLPHGLVRIMLAEQLYRTTTLKSNHPYHRGCH